MTKGHRSLLTRRGAIGAIGFAAAGVNAGPAAAQAARKTFVLVHGAWHGGWCWRRVADRLEARGHKVFAPTLTGLGHRSHLLNKDVNLATHVADVVNVLKWEELSGVVLVGHSYGGTVVSGVAEQMADKIASIVFLDAFVPENGESIESVASQFVKETLAAAKARGDLTLKPVPASVFRVNEKDRAWVDRLCTPHPIATLTDKSVVTGAREKIAKRTYVRANNYPNVPFDNVMARLKGMAGWRVLGIDAGHDVMVDAPERLTEMLIEAA